ncbi:MAG: peptidylprolyl isomerase [Planctomycetota bacterium]
MTDTTTIEDGTIVTIHYKLTLDDGEVVDTSEGRGPLAYLHGAQNIVPGLESALGGKEKGDELEVKVAPEEGYGQRIDEAVQVVPKDRFPSEPALEPGMRFQATDPQGMPLMGTILEIDSDNVTVDFNHPLAGQTLNFAVQVIDVRDATDAEKQQGVPQEHGAQEG